MQGWSMAVRPRAIFYILLPAKTFGKEDYLQEISSSLKITNALWKKKVLENRKCSFAELHWFSRKKKYWKGDFAFENTVRCSRSSRSLLPFRGCCWSCHNHHVLYENRMQLASCRLATPSLVEHWCSSLALQQDFSTGKIIQNFFCIMIWSVLQLLKAIFCDDMIDLFAKLVCKLDNMQVFLKK